MRYASIAVGLIFWCSAADAGERYTGFLTLGCGDRYIKLRNMPQTWYVNLAAEQEREIFRLARVERNPNYPWITLHVSLEAKRRAAPRPGYFGVHPQQINVERVTAARYLESGESIDAAVMPAQPFRGFLLVSPHGPGFVPLSQKDEFWWVVGGTVDLPEVYRHFQPPPENRIDNALVEIVGRVGPPGAYGHMGDYNREVAVDRFKFVRMVGVAEMKGTAAIEGDVKVAINMCKPQTR